MKFNDTGLFILGDGHEKDKLKNIIVKCSLDQYEKVLIQEDYSEQ